MNGQSITIDPTWTWKASLTQTLFMQAHAGTSRHENIDGTELNGFGVPARSNQTLSVTFKGPVGRFKIVGCGLVLRRASTLTRWLEPRSNRASRCIEVLAGAKKFQGRRRRTAVRFFNAHLHTTSTVALFLAALQPRHITIVSLPSGPASASY